MGYIYAIKIEGVGSAAGQYRWAWGRDMLNDPGTADPDSLYQTSLLKWPQQVTFGIDFKTSAPKLGSSSFELRRTDLTASTLYRYRRPVVAKLTQAITESDLNVVTNTSGLTGILILEREVMIITGENPFVPGMYSVTRGAFGSRAAPHGVGDSDDTELFQVHSAATLSKRRVDLIKIPFNSTGYADEETVWIGVLRGLTSPNPGRIRVEADNALSVIQSTELMTQQWKGQITLPYGTPWILARGMQTDELRRPDGGYGTDPETTRFVMGHKDWAYQAKWDSSRDGLASITLPGYQPFGGSAEIDQGNRPAKEDEVWEIISSSESQPSNAAVEAVNTLPLAQNPAILILQLLTSTDNGGSPGPNGAYDTGIANLSGNIPVSLIDVDGILAWARRVVGSQDKSEGLVESLHLGIEGEPEKLSDVIQRVLKPYGATLTQSSGGLISIAQLSDSLEYGEDAVAITQSQVLSIPSQDRRVWSAADKITAEYNDRPGVGPDTLKVTDGIRLQRVPEGEHNSVQLDITWNRSRDVAIELVSAWLARWHEPIPSVSLKTNNTVDLWPGDTCTLTHDKVYKADGTLGVTAGLYLVESRKETLSDQIHSYDYTLLYVGALYSTAPARIAPSCTVDSYDAGTLTINTQHSTWVGPNGSPIGPSDYLGFVAGDKIQIVDQYGAVVDPLDVPLTIQSVAAHALTLTGAPNTAPVAGDIVRVAPYGDSVTTQKEEWVYVSDANNLLDGTDPAKEYRFA